MRLLPIRTVTTILLVTQVGCATSNSGKRWWLIGAAVPVGATIGASTSPKDEKLEAHAVYWGAILGLVAAVVGNYYYSDEKEIERLKNENEVLQDPPLHFLKEGMGGFGKGGDGEPKGPIKWKRYKTNRWQKETPKTFNHIDEVIEITDENKK